MDLKRIAKLATRERIVNLYRSTPGRVESDPYVIAISPTAEAAARNVPHHQSPLQRLSLRNVLSDLPEHLQGRLLVALPLKRLL